MEGCGGNRKYCMTLGERHMRLRWPVLLSDPERLRVRAADARGTRQPAVVA